VGTSLVVEDWDDYVDRVGITAGFGIGVDWQHDRFLPVHLHPRDLYEEPAARSWEVKCLRGYQTMVRHGQYPFEAHDVPATILRYPRAGDLAEIEIDRIPALAVAPGTYTVAKSRVGGHFTYVPVRMRFEDTPRKAKAEEVYRNGDQLLGFVRWHHTKASGGSWAWYLPDGTKGLPHCRDQRWAAEALLTKACRW
jgi:hypothetical protein